MNLKDNKDQEFPLPPRSKKPGLLIAIIVILSIILAFLIYFHFDQKSKMTEMEEVLTSEKDSLAKELSGLIYQYDTLKTNNESMNIEISVQQDKIKRLLSVQVSNAQKIRLYKKELSTLRLVMKSYIRQIDSLNTRNIELTTENISVRSQLKEVENSNIELSKIKEELNSKVEIASILHAKNILAVSLNSKGKEKRKISKIDKIRICFTLRENPIASPGEKEVFLRIIRPDKIVVTSSVENLFEFIDKQLVYSAKRIVDYMNQDIDMCIYWNNDGQLIPGNYTIELYLDGNLIGNTSFVLN